MEAAEGESRTAALELQAIQHKEALVGLCIEHLRVRACKRTEGGRLCHACTPHHGLGFDSCMYLTLHSPGSIGVGIWKVGEREGGAGGVADFTNGATGILGL